jgi:hypothetical protein
MDGLGKAFNIVPTADGVWINLRDASAVTFICVGADTYTVQDASAAAGTGAANLAAIDHEWTNAGAVGATQWVKVAAHAATASLVVAANAAFTVDEASLRDGFKYVRCSSTAAGLVYAIVHDLKVARDPGNLPALAV